MVRARLEGAGAIGEAGRGFLWGVAEGDGGRIVLSWEVHGRHVCREGPVAGYEDRLSRRRGERGRVMAIVALWGELALAAAEVT